MRSRGAGRQREEAQAHLADGRKSDRLDAENLARVARLDPRLLAPIEHRGEVAQAHLALLRSRELAVRTRANLVNHVRGTVKPFGVRFARCSPEIFPVRVRELLPEALVPALAPILETISSLTERVRSYDRELEELSRELYPETALLRQVQGVGPLTALAFVLTVEDPNRFESSRSARGTGVQHPSEVSLRRSRAILAAPDTLTRLKTDATGRFGGPGRPAEPKDGSYAVRMPKWTPAEPTVGGIALELILQRERIKNMNARPRGSALPVRNRANNCATHGRSHGRQKYRPIDAPDKPTCGVGRVL